MPPRRGAAFLRAFFLQVLLFFFAAVPAGAQPFDALPGEWVVGPINVKTPDGLLFCSMKTRYADGRSVIVASDNEGVHSLAIDFGEKVLVAGAQHEVTFSMGDVRREILSVAATAEVLLSQMGDDGAFFDGMRRHDTLEAALNGQQLRFALTGAAEALDALQACTTARNSGKIYEPAKIVPRERLEAQAAQKRALAEEAARNEDIKLAEQALSSTLGEEVRRLREENQRLRQENQMAATRLKGGGKVAVTGEGEEASLLEALERKQRMLERENEHLRMRMETGAKATSAPLRPLPQEKKPDGAAARAATVPGEEKAKRPPQEKPSAPSVSAVAPLATAMTSGDAGASLPAAALLEAMEPVRPLPEKILVRLRGAGLSPEKMADAPVWHWQDAGIMATLQAWPQEAEDAEGAVDAYIGVLKSRCAGDFAYQAAAPEILEGLRLQMAEVACLVTETDSAAAGLAFVTERGQMAIVTYEADAETLPAALARRGALFSPAAAGGR